MFDLELDLETSHCIVIVNTSMLDTVNLLEVEGRLEPVSGADGNFSLDGFTHTTLVQLAWVSDMSVILT